MGNQYEDWIDGLEYAEVTKCQEVSRPPFTLKLHPINNTAQRPASRELL